MATAEFSKCAGILGFGGQLNETELITDSPSHLAKKKQMINGSFVTAWPFKSVL